MLLTASTVHAQDPPPLGISPEQPQAGEPLALRAPNTFCLVGQTNPQGLTQNQTVVNDLILVEIVAIPGVCVPLPLTYGSLPLEPVVDAGNYRLELYYVEPDITFPSDPSDRIFLGEITFSVGPAPIGVPMNSPGALLGLLLSLILLAWISLGRRETDQS